MTVLGPIDFKIVQETAKKLLQTCGDVLGLRVAVPVSVRELGLNLDQISAFCDATPDGEPLWVAFTARRDDKTTPEDYNFKDYTIEILAKTDHPVVVAKSE